MVSERDISIHAPLEGEWKFLRPPGHHPFAFDFVQTDGNRKSQHNAAKFLFFTGKISSDRFYCWNKPVYAPIDGEVIRVGKDWPDHEYTNIWKTVRIWYSATYRFRPEEVEGRLDIRPNAGNHVMIQSKEGYIVFLAHMRNQSITLSEGQQIRQGELIGMVGNSGNSTAPHLHINLFDQMDDPFQSKVIPFVFNSYESLDVGDRWIKRNLSVPEVGTFVRFK